MRNSLGAQYPCSIPEFRYSPSKSLTVPDFNVPCIHSTCRISAGGSLLFMRCVSSLTLTGLISARRRGQTSSAILAKSLSDCVTVLCLGQCKSRRFKVCGIMKRTCYFQTNGISYILNWGVPCLCCWWRWFHVLLFWDSSSNCPRLISNKNSYFIQTMISFIFVKICASEFTFHVLWIMRERNL